MAIRPQVIQPQPPAIGTIGVGTKVHRGVHRPGAAVRGGHRIGPSRRRWSRFAGLLVTQRAVRLVRQARKWARLGGAFALGLRWHGWGGQTRLRPSDMQHDEEPYDGEQSELVVKQV
jgi:hypothetical protein